jgi:hypothetical protein
VSTLVDSKPSAIDEKCSIPSLTLSKALIVEQRMKKRRRNKPLSSQSYHDQIEVGIVETYIENLDEFGKFASSSVDSTDETLKVRQAWEIQYLIAVSIKESNDRGERGQDEFTFRKLFKVGLERAMVHQLLNGVQPVHQESQKNFCQRFLAPEALGGNETYRWLIAAGWRSGRQTHWRKSRLPIGVAHRWRSLRRVPSSLPSLLTRT